AFQYGFLDAGVFYPYLLSKTLTRDGVTYSTQYNYDCGTFRCMQLQYKDETAGGSYHGTRHTSYTWYPAATKESSTPGIWKYNQVQSEVVDNNNSFGTLREFNYITGNMTAIEPLGVVERDTYTLSGDVA